MKIKKLNGEIIFEANKEDIKDVVIEAVKCGADLSGAYLCGANLYDADLYGANLSGADLSGAELRNADLRNANLRNADLSDANLRNANLGNADLRNADLGNADLGNADLRNANLYGANLRDADLGNADLRNANLRDANLRNADLGNANLYGANLRDADLRDAKNIPFIPIACPTNGEFIGWKKVNRMLVELLIPEDAKRSSATTEKCRCDKALVVSITEIYTGVQHTETVNFNYAKTIYHVGEIVYPDSFDDNRWDECSHGIHFFINKESAINY